MKAKWINAAERLPELPNPLPPNTPDEEGIIFVNRVHSCSHLWFPSYGYLPVLSVTEDGHWSLDQWEWLELSPSSTAPQGEEEAIHAMSNALKMFIENVDRWLETGEPATPEESKLIYDTAKAALAKKQPLTKLSEGSDK